MREKKGANRVETSSGQFENSIASDRLRKVFFVRVPAVTVPFSACFFLPVRSLVPFDLARGRSFLFPFVNFALGSFVSLYSALACMFYLWVYCRRQALFDRFFRASRCRAVFMGGPAMRAHSLARLLCTPRSHGTVIEFLERSALRFTVRVRLTYLRDCLQWPTVPY